MLKIIFLAALSISYFMLLKCECDLSLFQENNIVPSIIPEVPKQPLTVKLSQKTVSCGELLSTLSGLSLTPKINYDADEDTNYALIMIDPDAPLPDEPSLSPYLHWYIINIPGDDIDSGVVLYNYINPSPPPGSPEHRYIYLVFKQDDYKENYEYLRIREKFNLTDERNKLGLSEISFGSYYNVTSAPIELEKDALKKV